MPSLSPSESGRGFETLTREDLRIAFLLFVSHCGLLATLFSLQGKARASVMAPSCLGCQLRLPSTGKHSPRCLIFWKTNSVAHSWADRTLVFQKGQKTTIPKPVSMNNTPRVSMSLTKVMPSCLLFFYLLSLIMENQVESTCTMILAQRFDRSS